MSVRTIKCPVLTESRSCCHMLFFIAALVAHQADLPSERLGKPLFLVCSKLVSQMLGVPSSPG